MISRFWRKINLENKTFYLGLIPGFSAILFIIILRLLGTLQFLEWSLFDKLMYLRPQEKLDERILIIGINEKDIKQIKSYPIPDRDIAKLLKLLKSYQPVVIGLDIIRDLPQEPGHKEIVEIFQTTKNLIGIEKAIGDTKGEFFHAPPNLPDKQIGFADALIDTDGKQRRSLLMALNNDKKWRFSFPLKLTECYLKTKNIFLENVENDEYGIKFNSTIIPRFQPNSGGYIRADANSSQILINVRDRQKPFHRVSLTEIQSGQVNPDWIRGKIVMIGMTSSSAKDYATSSAINSKNPALIHGVEIQAHVVSQLVSAVLDQRSMINVWADGWEYLWIITWGVLGLVLGRVIYNPWKLLFGMAIAIFCLVIICYGLIIIGWWIPLVPAFLTLVLNGIGLAAFYRYNEALNRIQDRQLIIDQTFDAIHSHPLQTLNIILREVQSDESLSPPEFVSKLQQLNQELRDVYDLVRQEAVIDVDSFYLQQEQRLDLSQPLDEILFEVYNEIVERDYTYFQNIKYKVLKFEPLDERHLTTEQKRSLCRFLEEALRNVRKYAHGTTRLEVICTQEEGKNVIRVADNGLKIEAMADLSPHSGMGTKLAKNLAKQLHGEFKRYPNSPKGMVCQLTWTAKKFSLWRF
ncbi:CHASE2 domain-containing protein [Nostoc sp. TCL26-01]|uniref:sensor histidine kinase n=1 Tax=Nostoc sp. TCL26-01 TaxID=2576904 RepID=UPI0015B80694|nr:CHASE2 domain-containing protein [Nostoc sp. TCL26-01]QLE55100.1 CHASE2 domain-containing protein [Nostoc sp. TCL26-01]